MQKLHIHTKNDGILLPEYITFSITLSVTSIFLGKNYYYYLVCTVNERHVSE